MKHELRAALYLLGAFAWVEIAHRLGNVRTVEATWAQWLTFVFACVAFVCFMAFALASLKKSMTAQSSAKRR